MQESKPSLNEESTTHLLRVSEDDTLEPYKDDVLHHEEGHSNDDEDVLEGSSRMPGQDHREDDRDLVLPLFNETNPHSPSG